MIRQHDTPGPDANNFCSTGNVTDNDCGSGAGNARHVVVFRNPVTVVTEIFCPARKVQAVTKCLTGVAALCDRREIQYG